MRTLATNPTKDGLKESIARYWFTTPDVIAIVKGCVFQNGEQMQGYEVNPHHGGFKFVELAR